MVARGDTSPRVARGLRTRRGVGITYGVRDLNRAKQFYSEELGWSILQEHSHWVSFSLANGSSALGLYPWNALADDAGVAANGDGFRGDALSYIVRSEERVA